MAIKTRKVKAVIQFRRANESEWLDRDPILRAGEPALSLDIGKFKIGNGVAHWSELPYQIGSGGSGGTSSYLELSNLPSINRIILRGNKKSSDLGLQEAMDTITESDIDRILYGGL